MPTLSAPLFSEIANDFAAIEINATQQAVSLAHAHDMVGDWAIDPTVGRRLAGMFMTRGPQLTQQVQVSVENGNHTPRAETTIVPSRSDMGRVGNVAVIEVEGSLSKRGFSGDESSSTALLRQRVRQMRNDDSIQGMVLQINSPGGSVDGTEALAAEIRAAREQKPIVALVDGMAHSAAYWIASQASVIMMAGRTSSVGSIGVYILLMDSSQRAEELKLRPVLVRSKPERDDNVKGIGAPGLPLTDDQIAFVQERVSQLHEVFADGVADGLGITREQLDPYENGRSYLPTGDLADKSLLFHAIGGMDDAISLIMSGDDAVRRARGSDPKTEPVAKTAQRKEKVEMPDNNAPSLAEAKTLYPRADSDWFVEQYSGTPTRESLDTNYRTLLENRLDAQSEQIDSLKGKLSDAEKAAEKSKADADKAKADADKARDKPGASNDDIEGDADDGDDAVPNAKEVLDNRCNELISQGKPRHVAWAQACREHPQAAESLHKPIERDPRKRGNK